jgi:pentose-5-phosphate-3-epimerase
VEALRWLLPHVELVCVMTVNPGFAGQTLVPGAIEKIAEVARLIRGARMGDAGTAVELEVDGNVSWENIPAMIEAGAETLVTGTSSLYDPAAPLGDNLERLFRLIGRA